MGRRRKKDTDEALLFALKLLLFPVVLILWILGFFRTKRK